MKRALTGLVVMALGSWASSHCQAQQFRPFGTQTRDVPAADFRFNGNTWEFQRDAPAPVQQYIPYPGQSGNSSQFQPQVPQTQPPVGQPNPQYQQPNNSYGNQPTYPYSQPLPNNSQQPNNAYGNQPAYPYSQPLPNNSQPQAPNYGFQNPNLPQFSGGNYGTGGGYGSGVYCPYGSCDLVVPLDQYARQYGVPVTNNSYYQTPGANSGAPYCEKDHFIVLFRECDLEPWREYRSFSYSCEALDAAAALKGRGYLVRLARD